MKQQETKCRSKKDKMKQIIDKICKSKDFSEIRNLREDLDYLLEQVEEEKVRAWLKKNLDKVAPVPKSVW